MCIRDSGETVWNVENKICGMTDSPLTEKGRAQARELGEKLRTSGPVSYTHLDVYKRQQLHQLQLLLTRNIAERKLQCLVPVSYTHLFKVRL